MILTPRVFARTASMLLFVSASLLVVGQEGPSLTRADVEKMMKELSNWGRWGKDDQLGTLHFITPATRKTAAALVKEGVSVSLSRPLDSVKAIDNAGPFAIRPLRDGDFLMEEYTLAYHGYAHSHMDSLSHMVVAGKSYNNIPAPAAGRAVEKLTVDNYREGIFTRGVLVDLPRLKGVKYLEPGTAIFPADLDAWEKSSGVRVGTGDAIIIRTGRWLRRAEKGAWAAHEKLAGLHASCARWLKQRNISVFVSDCPGDVLPSRVEGVPWPLHQLLLVAMGTPMLDHCDLEALAEAAATRKRPTFLLVVAPLRVQNSTGSPVNPIAVF